MYYQSLITIETYLSNSKRVEDRMISRYVQDLDSWIITRKKPYKSRLNPLQFSIDYDVSSEISDYLFGLGLEYDLFDVYYEAETDQKENLGIISSEKFKDILKNGKTIIEHPTEEQDYMIGLNNVNILFALIEKPIKEFVLEELLPKKDTAPTFTGSNISQNMRKRLLNRKE